MKRLVPLIAIMVSLVVSSGAAAWHSNKFQSPSGNIICVYKAGAVQGLIICGTRDTHQVAWLTPYVVGHVREPRLEVDLVNAYGPILNYGKVWNLGGVITKPTTPTCYSKITGTSCYWNGNSFTISRAGVTTIRS